MSDGLLMTVSMRSALPSLRYCLTRLCLYAKSIFTSVPGPKIRVRNWPAVVRRTCAAEDGVDSFGAADADVVGDERFEEPPGPAGVVQHEGAGHLDLAHRQFPPVARRPGPRR